MANQASAILLTAFLFYLLIPGFGAFVVRARWRRFRRNVINASLLPILSYADLRKDTGQAYRFFGKLEAVQGDHRVWLSDGKLSVALELEHVWIYAVPSVEGTGGGSGIGRNEIPRVLSWDAVGSLPEGTPFFVAGRLAQHDGSPTFEEDPQIHLFVMLYEGSERRLLSRSIWVGRQRNEYWNVFTPVALAAGFVAQLLLAYLFFREGGGRIFGLTALTVALLPALPLFPPGIIPFFGYRRFWGRARLLRARRDLLRLPERFDFKEIAPGNWEADLPSGGKYRKKTAAGESPVAGNPLRKGVDNENIWYRYTPEFSERDLPDPWAESVVVSGNTERLARKAETRARRLELIAVLLFVVGLIMNSYLAFFALSYLL
mgnify:CR=1 FL=1